MNTGELVTFSAFCAMAYVVVGMAVLRWQHRMNLIVVALKTQAVARECGAIFWPVVGVLSCMLWPVLMWHLRGTEERLLDKDDIWSFLSDGRCPVCGSELEMLNTCAVCPNPTGNCVGVIYQYGEYAQIGGTYCYPDGTTKTAEEVEDALMKRIKKESEER